MLRIKIDKTGLDKPKADEMAVDEIAVDEPGPRLFLERPVDTTVSGSQNV